ncbi:MAG: HYR domain-containing protein, partial [Bacteroidota bacterium]
MHIRYLPNWLCVVFCLCFIHIQAQTPTFIGVQQPAACGATTYVVDVVVENFTDLRGVEFMLTWDSAVLNLNSITNPNTTLSPPVATGAGGTVGGSFSMNTTNTLGFAWLDFAAPETLADGSILFSLVFDVLMPGNTTVAEFPESMRPPALVTPRNDVIGANLMEIPHIGVSVELTQGGGTDNIPPVITNCPTSPVTVTVPAGTTSYTLPSTLPWTIPTGTDNCGTAVLNTNATVGTTVAVGSSETFFYAYEDSNGNTSDTCRIQLDVVEDTTTGNAMPTVSTSIAPVLCDASSVDVCFEVDNL